MLFIQDFALRPESVVCPTCNTVFATPAVAKLPAITAATKFEADLHRILPDPFIRSAFIAICPQCTYSWWFSAFAPHYIVPDLVVEAPEVEYPKKFAHSVLTGRKNGAHALDRAMLAMNGLWCNRELHTVNETLATAEYDAENKKWLTLVIQELDAALQDLTWQGNRNRYHYIMGEMLRQLGDFEGAIQFFESVDRRSLLPRQLVTHQIQMAQAGQAQPVELPPHLVEEIFLAKAPKEEPAPQAAAAPVPPVPAYNNAFAASSMQSQSIPA